MNAEQKERAKDALTNCQASDMAALLQELVDAPEADPFAVIHLDGSFVHVEFKQTVAGTGKFEVYAAPPVQSVPEPEPFGYFKSEPFGWTDCAETDDGAIALYELPPAPEPVAYATGYYGGYLSIATVDGRVLPAGTALYAAPPHQSEYHLEMVNTPAPSGPDGWKLVPVEPTDEMVWKAEEDSPPFYHGDPWYGSEPPSEGQINAIYKAMLEAAPQPPALTDARILEIAMSDDVSLVEYQGPGVRPRITVHNSIGGVYALARAIEREILGGQVE